MAARLLDVKLGHYPVLRHNDFRRREDGPSVLLTYRLLSWRSAASKDGEEKLGTRLAEAACHGGSGDNGHAERKS
jgi:hypothetical protein